MTSFFITCTHCGQHNEIQSEYLTFCSRCKKKLDSNFRDWLKKNREGTFEQYKSTIGRPIDELGAEKTIEKRTSQAKNIYYKVALIFILFSTLIFSLFPKLITESQLLLYVQSLIQEKADELDWKTETYGDYGLHFDSPVELKPIQVNFPPDYTSQIVDFQLYASDFNKDIAIMAVSNKFHPSAANVSLESSITRFVDQIRQLKGIGDFTIVQEATSMNGFQGFKQIGQFTRNGELKGFISIGVGEGRMLWQIMIVYNLRNEELQGAKDRIINSVKILYNSRI